MPLPELKRPGWRVLVSGAMALGVLACAIAGRERIAALPRTPRLAVTSIEVTGNRHVAPEEIIALSGVRKGDPWLLVNVNRSRRLLRSHPWVDDAVIERPWIGRVRVEVRECVPVAVLEWGGARHGVAEDMRILPANAESGSALPRIRGVIGSGRRGLDLESFERAFEYVGAIRRERGVSALPVVLTLDRSGRDVLLVEAKGVEAILEEPVPPAQAVKNLAAFLETLDSPGSVRGTLHVYSKTTAVWKGSKV